MDPLRQQPSNLPKAEADASTAPPLSTIPAATVSFQSNLPATDPIASADSVIPGVQVGDVLDGYTIVGTIGVGGMGVVFKARQAQTNQLVALKMIRGSTFGDRAAAERFRQEIQTLGRLQPVKNIVPIYHVGEFENRSFFVMPYLAAGSLSGNLKRFQNNHRKAVTLVEKVARAVHHLHVRQILHRDIKPDNILLDAADEPVLSDFGLTKLLDLDASLTRVHEYLGTPAYMAPEQTGLGAGKIDARTDVWALGVLLYELLAGVRPFRKAPEEETASLLRRIVADPPARPRSLQPDIDPGLEAVILKCLEKQPDDRFASAEELANELSRWLHDEPVRTRHPHSGLFRAQRFVRNHRRLLTAVILLATMIGITAVALLYFNHEDRALWNIQNQIARGQPVTLIEAAGPPLHAHKLFGDDVQLSSAADRLFTVTAIEPALVELARDLPIKRYRLSGKVRHLNSVTHGYVGVYVGHAGVQPTEGMYHAYAEIAFNDIIDRATLLNKDLPMPPAPILNAALFRPVIRAELTKAKDWIQPFATCSIGVFQAKGMGGGAWRKIQVTVEPKALRLQFDAAPAELIDLLEHDDKFVRARDDWVRQYPDHFKEISDRPTAFRHDGSLGIAVRGGSAEFADFILEPLIPKENE